MKFIFTVLAIFLLHTSLFSAVIRIDPNEVAGNDNINFFNALIGGGGNQTINGELTISTGDNNDQQVKFAEKFLGQNVVNNPKNANFDLLQGNATGPLTLSPGINGQNLFFVLNRFGALGRLGNVTNGRGEGSLAILFPIAVLDFVIEVNDIANAAGEVVFGFFDSDGNTIDTVTLTGLAARNTIAFGTDNDVLIAGVTITNFDTQGVTFENLRFEADVNNVPEPGTYLLLAIGSLIAFIRFGRKKAVQEEVEA